MKYINGLLITIRDQWMHLISTIGDWRKERQKKRAEKKFVKLKSKFNFVIDPTTTFDRIVVINGDIYRVQISEHGYLIRDEVTDTPVEDIMVELKVLERLS